MARIDLWEKRYRQFKFAPLAILSSKSGNITSTIDYLNNSGNRHYINELLELSAELSIIWQIEPDYMP